MDSDPIYSAVVYDFGNVLVEIDFDRVMASWAESAGMAKEQVASRFTHGAAYQAHERGEIDAARYFQALRGELGIDISDAEFLKGWLAVFGEEIAPAIALLPQLAPRVPQYLFSNTNAAHYAYWSKRYAAALSPLVRHFVSHEMGCRKPERASFEYIAREIGVTADRILFFDDTSANIEGARAAGVNAVLVRSPEDVSRAVQPWLGGSPTAA